MLLDATEEIPLTHQDLTIVASIAKQVSLHSCNHRILFQRPRLSVLSSSLQGKGVVLALNKVDVLSEKVKKKILKYANPPFTSTKGVPHMHARKAQRITAASHMRAHPKGSKGPPFLPP